MDDFLDSIYVETTNRYVDTDLPKQIIYEDSTTSEITKRFKSINIKECNLDSFVAIDKDGHIIPLKKWIIATVYELFLSEQFKYSWNNNRDWRDSYWSLGSKIVMRINNNYI